MRKCYILMIAVLLTCGLVTAQETTKSKAADKKTAQNELECPHETDMNSPRHTQLQGNNTSSTQVLRIDVDKDGDPDIIESWWNGCRVRWFDENDNALPTDTMGDRAGDMLQIDRDGDGFYDGPDDMTVKWVDDGNDGHADLEVVGINPTLQKRDTHAGNQHYMIFEDVDHDGVFGCVDWRTFDFPCWRISGHADFMPDYDGNSIFLKIHEPALRVKDPRYNWENPFAFYDTDNDGVTEMAMRFCDNPIHDPKENGKTTFDGKLDEAFVTWDLDNDTQKGNEMDYDMTMRFEGGDQLDYNKFRNKHPNLKAADWVQKYMRFPNWRQIDELIYVPHDKCYSEIFRPNWGKAYFVFDEDDDDHRWERVEIYYPTDDVYRVSRWKKGHEGGGLMGHPQSDMLGDRGEYDMDFSGHGKVYVGKWDKKIHLYGAEWGAWLVDYGAKYWGSWPVVGDSSPAKPDKVEEVVQYKDTDNDGFFDQIIFDYDGDRNPDLTVSLKEIGTGDKVEVLDPAKLKWQGMNQLFTKISEESWNEAMQVYMAAWNKGLLTNDIDDLAICASTGEKYDHGYWLKEKIFRLVNKKLGSDDAARKQLVKLYFSGDIEGFAKFIRGREWLPDVISPAAE